MYEAQHFFINVYRQCDGVHTRGECHRSYDRALMADAGASYRLHIRFKPPGAPKRYSSKGERRLWETGMLGPARASYIAEKTRERLA